MFRKPKVQIERPAPRKAANTFLTGLLWGGLIAGATALLTAPAAGKVTRRFLRAKGHDWSNRVRAATHELQGQARVVGADVATQTRALVENAQLMVDLRREQLERTAHAAQETWNESAPDRRLAELSVTAAANGVG